MEVGKKNLDSATGAEELGDLNDRNEVCTMRSPCCGSTYIVIQRWSTVYLVGIHPNRFLVVYFAS